MLLAPRPVIAPSHTKRTEDPRKGVNLVFKVWPDGKTSWQKAAKKSYSECQGGFFTSESGWFSSLDRILGFQ
jgi:hypothetical protein